MFADANMYISKRYFFFCIHLHIFEYPYALRRSFLYVTNYRPELITNYFLMAQQLSQNIINKHFCTMHKSMLHILSINMHTGLYIYIPTYINSSCQHSFAYRMGIHYYHNEFFARLMRKFPMHDEMIASPIVC